MKYKGDFGFLLMTPQTGSRKQKMNILCVILQTKKMHSWLKHCILLETTIATTRTTHLT